MQIELKVSQSDLEATNNNISGLTTRMTKAESSITINANNIASKVSANGVISAINQSPESIKLSASKIDLSSIIGTDIRTTNTNNYLHIHDAYMDMYFNNECSLSVGSGLFRNAQIAGVFFGVGAENKSKDQPNTIGYHETAGGTWSNYTGEIDICAGRSVWIGTYEKGYEGTIKGAEMKFDEDGISISGETKISGHVLAKYGFTPNSTWSVTLPPGTTTEIQHNLGHIPIVNLSGTVGNCVLTYWHRNANSVVIGNNGTAAWNGSVLLW